MRRDVLARLERLKTKTLTSKGRKKEGEKSNLGAEPCSSLAAPLPGIWGFSSQMWTRREALTAGLQPATQALHRSQHRPGLALVFLSGGESSPGQMKFLDRNLAKWLQPRDLESPKVIQAILQGRFHNFCLRLANKKPPNTDRWQRPSAGTLTLSYAPLLVHCPEETKAGLCCSS